jgi:hypothetical protein
MAMVRLTDWDQGDQIGRNFAIFGLLFADLDNFGGKIWFVVGISRV